MDLEQTDGQGGGEGARGGAAATSSAKFPGNRRNAAGLLLSGAAAKPLFWRGQPAGDDAPRGAWGFGEQGQSHSCCGSCMSLDADGDEPVSAGGSVLGSAVGSGCCATPGWGWGDALVPQSCKGVREDTVHEEEGCDLRVSPSWLAGDWRWSLRGCRAWGGQPKSPL